MSEDFKVLYSNNKTYFIYKRGNACAMHKIDERDELQRSFQHACTIIIIGQRDALY